MRHQVSELPKLLDLTRAQPGLTCLPSSQEELIFIIRDSTVRQLSTVIAHLGSLEQRPDLKLLDTVCESLKRHVDAFTAGQVMYRHLLFASS